MKVGIGNYMSRHDNNYAITKVVLYCALMVIQNAISDKIMQQI